MTLISPHSEQSSLQLRVLYLQFGLGMLTYADTEAISTCLEGTLAAAACVQSTDGKLCLLSLACYLTSGLIQRTKTSQRSYQDASAFYILRLLGAQAFPRTSDLLLQMKPEN
jgi:hypothetical protein